MIIRKKQLDDCEAWVDVNIQSWHVHLKGIVSESLLKKMRDNRDSRIEKDRENFLENDWDYVLEEDGEVLGIMRLKPSERKGFENAGEVQMLYLAPHQKGKGYGKALIYKAFEVLKNKGYRLVVIGCLADNPSNAFYKHVGGRLVRQESWDVFDEHYLENIYEYDLSKF